MKKTPSPLLRLLAAACLVLSGWAATPVRLAAQTTTQNFSYTPGAAIPDNSTVGVSDTHAIASTIVSISSIRVTLNITGSPAAYNGDFYAYLTNGSGFTVLLNRAGRTATNAFGYADNGFNVTFDDAAANGDIHGYRSTLNPAGGALTGTWQPDGRNVNPATALDTNARTTTLGSFTGQSASGNWTLFVADASSVGAGTFAGWGLQITGTTVPEPATWALLGAGGGLLLACRSIRQRQRAA